jgi:CelD/BcsL family acetyltransferase involved in cellulose biosynthesis
MTEPAPTQWQMVPFGELTAAHLDRWRTLQASDPALDSPYFDPAFAATAAAADPRVRIVLGLDAQDMVLTVLPLRVSRRAAYAAGFPAADFQGPICAPDTPFDARAMMRACRLSSLHLDHLRRGVRGVAGQAAGARPSPYVDISGGLEAYLGRVSKSGKSQLAEARRHERQAERDHGPYRFVADSTDPALLEQVIELKRRQYLSTGARDYFAVPEQRRLVTGLLGCVDGDFAGMLCAVFAGEHLLAAHFGIRRGPVLHWWFPVYDPVYSRLGPGWLLLRSVIAAAPQLGLARLDLGRGEDDYKRRAMTGSTTVDQLSVDLNPVRRVARRAEGRLREKAKSSEVIRDVVQRARRRGAGEPTS